MDQQFPFVSLPNSFINSNKSDNNRSDSKKNRVVAIRSLANNKYVTVYDDNLMIASEDHYMRDSEKFEIVNLKNNYKGLRSLYTNRFVCAENAGCDYLRADREVADVWEEFELIQLTDSKVGIRACINGRFVCAESAGKDPLIANRDGVKGTWEEFVLVDA